jgi:adenylate cyclase
MDQLVDNAGYGAQDTRKLVAVLYADMVGYSRLIGLDASGTVSRLQALRRRVIDPAIEDCGGAIIQTGGDSLLAAFDSIDGAVRCGIRIQREIPATDGQQPPDRHIRFRIGINIGDVIAEGTNLHGDCVNVAARLESVCPVGGICVARAVRDHLQGNLNLPFQALGALSLKNIPEPTEAFVLRLEQPETAPNPLVVYPSAATVPQPNKASIAVLRFANLSGDPEQEYFSDGIAEDIITALSRFRSLFVIARNSSFAYDGRAGDVRSIARELGVRYVHEGSVRRIGTRVRVTAQLIDAQTGSHLWAERYDREVTDVFAVQDEITNSVALAIQPAIARAEQRRAMRKPPAILDAWECYQRGLWHRAQGGLDGNARARDMFAQAIEGDPTFAPPLYATAQTYFEDAYLYHGRMFEEAAALAAPLAHRAVALDPDDAEVYAVLALVAAAHGDVATELARAEQALSLNANCALGWSVRGVCLICMGQLAAGREIILTALSVSPRDARNRWTWSYLPMAYYLLGDYPGAVETASRAIAAYSPRNQGYRWLAAAFGQLGRVAEAQDVMKQAAAHLAPVAFDDYARRREPWLSADAHAHLLEGLRKAGWRS